MLLVLKNVHVNNILLMPFITKQDTLIFNFPLMKTFWLPQGEKENDENNYYYFQVRTR